MKTFNDAWESICYGSIHRKECGIVFVTRHTAILALQLQNRFFAMHDKDIFVYRQGSKHIRHNSEHYMFREMSHHP